MTPKSSRYVLFSAVLVGLSLGCHPDATKASPSRPASAPQPVAAGSSADGASADGVRSDGARAERPQSGQPLKVPAQQEAAEQAPTQPAAVAVDEPVRTEPYPWHHDDSIEALEADSTLRRRFAPPQGYSRVKLPEGSFGAWLREVPLAIEGTPVRSYSGGVLLPADHRNIAAVTTLDIGDRDLQQCADAVMRMHAEWLWHSGRAAEASYKSGAGPIPWQRFVAGGYTKPKGVSFEWGQRSPRKNNHATYRKYMDVVFAWSNTVALAQQGRRPERAEVRPGDFFVLPGSPGHTVLILDVAERDGGDKVALLGQSFMPAQSFQVLRPSRDQVWFSLASEDGVQTPFWRRFPWSSLRRLDGSGAKSG